MSQPAEIPRVAPVVSLDDWRREHLPAGQRAVLDRLQAAGPREILHGWHDLSWIGQTDKLDAIRIYERQGLHPILLHGVNEDGSCTCGKPHEGDEERSIGKHPVYRGWQTAPLDLEKLGRDLRRNWRFNLGLRMGRQPSGVFLVTIDVDGDRSLLAPFEAKLGPLPPTLTATSGKGYHLIFRYEGNRPPKNRVKLGDGIDVRSEGGQIVAAPSTHRTGRKYRWIDVREPAVLP